MAKAEIPNYPAKEKDHPPSILLWPDGAPNTEAARRAEAETVDWRDEPENNITFPVTFNIHNPSITPYIPDKEIATGAAVIIAPGGGHWFLTTDREGYDLGALLARNGIAAFVLKYRLERDYAGDSPYKTDPEALNDALRAIRTVRSRAAEWNVNPAHVGIIGFSAGGQVAGLVEMKYDAGKPDAPDPIDRINSRPDFVAMVYGWPNPNEFEVNENTPPTYLMCTYTDGGAMRNIVGIFSKLREARVPAEMHIYGTGGHGFGVRPDRPELSVSNWHEQFRGWLNDIGMLKKE